MTCDQLLDHNGYQVRACILSKKHTRPHSPGPWRVPTVAERDRIEDARPADYEHLKGMPILWTERRVRRFSR